MVSGWRLLRKAQGLFGFMSFPNIFDLHYIGIRQLYQDRNYKGHNFMVAADSAVVLFKLDVEWN